MAKQKQVQKQTLSALFLQTSAKFFSLNWLEVCYFAYAYAYVASED